MSLRQPRSLFWPLGVALIALQTGVIAVVGWYAASRFDQADRNQMQNQILHTDATTGSSTIRLVALAVMAASGLITVAILVLFSRRLERSVSRLVDGAGRIAAGNVSQRIRGATIHELRPLAVAIDEMGSTLGRQIAHLRRQQRELEAVQQSMSNGLIALDLEQRVISVNRSAERLLNLSGGAVRGRLVQEVLREPALNRFVADAIADESRLVAEFRLRGGRGVTVEAVCEPLRDADDELVGVLILLTDVTQLRRLERIRSDFAANVSHELRTPITNIQGYVETLLQVGVEDPEQARSFLQVIKRNTERLASIVEDLLSLARIEQPEMRTDLERTATPVRGLIDAVLIQFEAARAEKQMVIDTHVPDDLSVCVNWQLAEQAVGNLLSNAIKYSPASTRVRLSAAALNESEIEIAVTDDGLGIEPQHLPRLFERFYRVDKARSRELGGTGLGLAIVRHIALAHGGRVEVESEIGRGSTFRLILPRAEKS